jgi:hypothetical protein
MVKNEMEASYEIYILFYQSLNKLHDQRRLRKRMLILFLYTCIVIQDKYFIKVSPLDLQNKHTK